MAVAIQTTPMDVPASEIELCQQNLQAYRTKMSVIIANMDTALNQLILSTKFDN